MALNLPKLISTLAIVTDLKTPTIGFHIWWQKVTKAIEEAFTNLEGLVLDIQAALEAAGIAIAAAADAQTAADTAQTAADLATAAAEDTGALVSVVSSGVDSNPLSATDAGTDATIVIASHNRIYADGTSVAVTGSSITSRAYSTTYWVYYDDPTRVGGAVSFVSTTTENTAAQTGNRHLVGRVLTPAALAGPTNGDYLRPPGLGQLEP